MTDKYINTKDSNSYNSSLLSGHKSPKINQPKSLVNIFETRIEEDYKNNLNENHKSISYNYDTRLMYCNLKKSIFNIISHRNSLHKIKLKPINKRNIIYDSLINNVNSIFTSKYSRNIKPLKRLPSLNSLSLTPLNKSPNKIDYLINSFDNYEKDFFPDFCYLNLEYNEFEIFKNKSIYDNLIKDKINYFKKNKNENQSIKLEKEFHYGKCKKKINLTLDSMIISFRDMFSPNDEEDKCIQINFPFALLPIFYYKGFETFLKFLSVVIKIENNSEKITLIDYKIYDALNELKDFEIKNEDCEIAKCGDFSFDRNEKEKIIELRPQMWNKNMNFLKFNYFIFYWVANTKTFIVKITLPCIHLNIVDNNI